MNLTNQPVDEATILGSDGLPGTKPDTGPVQLGHPGEPIHPGTARSGHVDPGDCRATRLTGHAQIGPVSFDYAFDPDDMPPETPPDTYICYAFLGVFENEQGQLVGFGEVYLSNNTRVAL